MKIFLHIGPHKTGTTSIQHWLKVVSVQQESKLSFVSREQRYFYPLPEKYGPGHAEISWKTMGINGHASSLDEIKKYISLARKKGFEKIVFSSEEFSRGMVENTFPILRKLKDEGDLIIIVTLNNLVDRLRSEVFEQIRYNCHFEDISNPNVFQLMRERPGLTPDFVPRVITEAQPNKVVVCLSDKTNKNKIFGFFREILDIKTDGCDEESLNESDPYMTTYILNEYNKIFPDMGFSELRELADKTFCLIKDNVDDLPEFEFPGFDQSVSFVLSSIWNLQLDYLSLLQKNGGIDFYR